MVSITNIANCNTGMTYIAILKFKYLYIENIFMFKTFLLPFSVHIY